jgi:hypothetical protein
MKVAQALILAAIALSTIGLSAGARAQSKAVWSDIDCAHSKLVVPPGLRCRATQEMAGSNSAKFAASGGMQGTFREWSAVGAKDGLKLYYIGHETIGSNAYKAVYLTLEEEIRTYSPYARDGRNFTSPSQKSAGDYVRFTGAQGEDCVAIRKVGPVQSKGYKWVILSNKCVSAGQSISDDDIGQLISATDFRP